MEQYRSELVNFCRRRRIPNAEDVVQDVFVRAIEYWHTYTEKGQLKAWLYSIMLRTVVPNRTRKAAREDLVYVEEFWAESPDPSPETMCAAQQAIDIIDEMPEMYREILHLRMVLGMSFNEIIEQLDIPLGTALSRAHRGRQALKEAFDVE